MKKLKNKHDAEALMETLSDGSFPLELRTEILKESIPLLENPDFVQQFCKFLESANAKSTFQKRSEQLSAMIKDLEAGPFRSAVFVGLSSNGSKVNHAQVLFDDGTDAFSVVADEKLAGSLRKGDRVLLDGRGKLVLRKSPNPLKIGTVATFERVVDGGYMAVTNHNQETFVYLPSQELEEAIESKEISPGDTVIVNPRQSFAFGVLPSDHSCSHYQFLSRQTVPDVIAHRDIGSPPKIIERVSQFVELEMTDPKIRRRFGLRRSSMNLLTGIPGTGKTLTIEAIWREIYRIMGKITGLAIDQLPPRVFKLKMSSVLSEWLGRSDKNVDRFFDEVEQMASERWEAPDGTEYELPVLVILEEIDGIARTRGGQDAVYDRILTGILQRLDPNRASFKEKLIIFAGTTNEPKIVDSAFSRRIGAYVEKFGGLNRAGFVKVMEKQTSSMPLTYKGSQQRAQDAIISDLTSWLFAPNGSDQGVVEIAYVAGNSVDIRYRRDFLTGALIDRAVQQAAEKAAGEAASGENGSGIHLEHLMDALDCQIWNTAEQLSEHNLHKFLEIPDAARVASVRRLPQPDLSPLQLQFH